MKFYYNSIIDDYNIEDNFIFFYNSPFSQWFPCRFKFNNIEFNSSEQFMMYYKAILMKDFEIANIILKTKKPSEIKILGRKIRNFNQDLWDRYKTNIVLQGNILKFTQDKFCNFFILNNKFNNKEFVEASLYDSIWGIGLDFNGRNSKEWGLNLLGKILTRVKHKIIIGKNIHFLYNI